MKTTIWINLCGDWVPLNGADKINGTLAYNWLQRVEDLCNIKDDFVGIVHGGIEYVVHKSCLQLAFTKDD